MVAELAADPAADSVERRAPSADGPLSRWWLAGLAVVLAGAVAHQRLFTTLAEDAFISLRYSAQLVAGNGPVFNPGERVEGYSNFLWVVLVAAPGFVAHVDLVTAARLLGVACTVATVALVALLVRRITGSGWAGVGAAALTAASGSVAAYGPSGLETPLFTALLLAAVVALLADQPVLAGLLVAAATMTRPDGALVGLVLLAWLAARREWRPAVRLLAAAAVPGAVWTAWRLSYYGHLLPNPIAAKSGMDLGWQLESGWAYLAGFAQAAWPLLVLAAVAVVALALRPPAPAVGPPVVLLASLALVYTAFFVVAGGDWMPAWRFFAPAVPLLAAIVGVGLSVVWTLPERVTAAAAVAVVCVLGVATSITNPMMLDRVRLWHRQVDDLASVGGWLNRTLPPGTVIATFANGALSYQAKDLVVVDLLGLTDEHIAREGDRDPRGVVGHAAHDWDYVTGDRRPEVIVDNGNGWWRAPSCWVRPELADDYVPRLFQPAPGLWMTVLVRADRADEVTALLAADRQYVVATEQCT